MVYATKVRVMQLLAYSSLKCKLDFIMRQLSSTFRTNFKGLAVVAGTAAQLEPCIDYPGDSQLIT